MEESLFAGGLYIRENCFKSGWATYERLVDHPEGMKFRRLIDSDHYDYVTKDWEIEGLEWFWQRLHNKVNCKSIKSAAVRLEGEVNRNWDLTLADGTVLRFYSVEGSPQDERDFRVDEYDGELCDLLEALSNLSGFEDLWNPDEDAIDYVVHFEDGRAVMVDNFVTQKRQEDGDYKYINQPLALFL